MTMRKSNSELLQVICPDCKGKGTATGNFVDGMFQTINCYYCKGTGKLTGSEIPRYHHKKWQNNLFYRMRRGVSRAKAAKV